MHIQVSNLPFGTTFDEIKDLFCHMSIIESIRVSDANNPNHAVAWIRLSCSQTGANAISRLLDGKHFKGRTVSTYTTLFLQ